MKRVFQILDIITTVYSVSLLRERDREILSLFNMKKYIYSIINSIYSTSNFDQLKVLLEKE